MREGGGSASEMEAFILPFCWSANALKGKERAWWKKWRRGWSQRNHLIADHPADPISPFALVRVDMPGLCLLHSSVTTWTTDHVLVAPHFCFYSAQRKSFGLGESHLQMKFWQVKKARFFFIWTPRGPDSLGSQTADAKLHVQLLRLIYLIFR